MKRTSCLWKTSLNKQKERTEGDIEVLLYILPDEHAVWTAIEGNKREIVYNKVYRLFLV